MTAPGPPTTEPAVRPTRPDSIRLAVQLWFVVIVMQIVAMAANWSVLRADFDKRMGEVSKQFDDAAFTDSSGVVFVAGVVLIVLVLTAIAGTLMWFSYAGYNWARLLLGWASAYITVTLVFAVIALFMDAPADSSLPEAPAWAMVPTILGGVCAVGALTALMHRDSAGYCRDAASFRTRRRQNGF